MTDCLYCGGEATDEYEGRPWCGKCDAEGILKRAEKHWRDIMAGRF